jgi:hypothetical protein
MNDPIITTQKIKAVYRLRPIIIGFRCDGYSLQKQHTILGMRYWKAIRGEFREKVRVTKSGMLSLVDISKSLEELAEHLSTIKHITFYK